jgi:hypothetical protein
MWVLLSQCGYCYPFRFWFDYAIPLIVSNDTLWEIMSMETGLACNYIVLKTTMQLGHNYIMEIQWINN